MLEKAGIDAPCVAAGGKNKRAADDHLLRSWGIFLEF